jgi:hypothetical protein
MSLLPGTASPLTTDEILLLKKNGVSEQTIQLMIQSDMQNKNRADSSIQITDTKSATTYSTGKSAAVPLTQEEQRNMERAWKMLENLSVEIESGKK